MAVRPMTIGCTPAARHAAARTVDGGLPASAIGRLVWVGDRRAASGERHDPAALAAASSVELMRAAATVGGPAVLAVPFARTSALDRVLAWHDAIVVMQEPEGSATVMARALASLSELRRPVVAMAQPGRVPAALAVAGLCAPAEAARAVAELGAGWYVT